MADHKKIYGICENKCQHEVYRKDDADETFLKKTEARDLYAIKSHATSKTTYGIGTSAIYGHVQIQTSLDIPEQASAGKALAASAGKVLNDKISRLESQLENLANIILLRLSPDIEDLKADVEDLTERVEALENAQ